MCHSELPLACCLPHLSAPGIHTTHTFPAANFHVQAAHGGRLPEAGNEAEADELVAQACAGDGIRM